MKTKEQVTKSAQETKIFLDKKTGVKWKIRVWNNMGWHSSLCFGTLSVYLKIYVFEKSYHLMNGARECGYGHIELHSEVANTKNELLNIISKSLKEQKGLVHKYIDGYNLNKKLKQFITL